MTWANRWKGGEAFCLASGPSLTQEDIDKVIEWRNSAPGRYVIVCNTTYQKALTADAVYAHDYKWWKKYHEDVVRDFKGERFTGTASPERFPVIQLPPKEFKNFGFSGAGSISLAIYTGIIRVNLLGFDCRHGPNGEVHHHGNHPRGLGNAGSMLTWPAKLERLADHASVLGVEAVNFSRRTVLTCFKKGDLDAYLQPGASA